ncbi:hypothetical protein GCM10009735_81920 [Actinomadura chokoriensis]
MHDRTNATPVRVMPPAAKYGPVAEWERVRTPMPPATPSVPWATSAQDPDRAVTDLSGRFPSATIWFGEYTGSYWALIHTEDGTPRLIEATTSAELRRRLDSLDLRLPQRLSPSAPQNHATPYPVTEAQPSSLRRPARGHVRCRGRHCMPRTLSRSGRC